MLYHEISTLILNALKNDQSIAEEVVGIFIKRPSLMQYPSLFIHKISKEYIECSGYQFIKSKLVVDVFSNEDSQCSSLIKKVTQVLNNSKEIEQATPIQLIEARDNHILQLKDTASTWRGRVDVKLYIVSYEEMRK